MSYPLENALFQWEEGWRSLQEIDDPKQRRLADRVIAAIRNELRRRIGPTFSAAELAELYGRGTDWCQQAALDVAPGAVEGAQALAEAAFWIYLRGATDFAGGKQLPSDRRISASAVACVQSTRRSLVLDLLGQTGS